jgi:hypothetical protein
MKNETPDNQMPNIYELLARQKIFLFGWIDVIITSAPKQQQQVVPSLHEERGENKTIEEPDKSEVLEIRCLWSSCYNT